MRPCAAARIGGPTLRPRLKKFVLVKLILLFKIVRTFFLYIFDRRGGGGVHKSLSLKIPHFESKEKV